MLVDRRGASNSGTNGHTTNPFRELGANVRAYDTESTNEFTAQTPMRNAVEVQSAVDRGIRGFYYDQQGDRAEVEAEILPFTLADFQRTKGMGVKVYNRVKSGDISHCLHQMNKQGKVKWSLEHGDRVACGTCTNQTRLCAYFGDGIVWVRPLLSTFRKGNPTESTFWVRSQRDKMEMSWTPRNLWQVFPQTGKKRQRI